MANMYKIIILQKNKKAPLPERFISIDMVCTYVFLILMICSQCMTFIKG